jgi:hypothetical protein
MAAGTQGFIDTRKDTDHIGMVVGKILEARKLAEDERKYAEQMAEKYQTSLEEAGIKRGYFFKKALGYKFGGEYKEKKLAQLEAFKKRASFLKSATTGKSGRNKLNLQERGQAIFDMMGVKSKSPSFRDRFTKLYEGFVDDPLLRPKSDLVKPGTAKKFKKVVFGDPENKKKISKEDILSSLLLISQALEKTAQSISEKNDIISQNIVSSSQVQASMLDQLKTSGSGLEDKLDQIVEALNKQNHIQKQSVKKAETKDRENKIEQQADAASTVAYDDLSTPENEAAYVSPVNQMIPATSSQATEMQQVEAYGGYPQLETGGIVSGPDSGYLAKLHGNEMVVPLDNNYTQGQPSAVDGKVRPKPIQKSLSNSSGIQQYETGTKQTSPVTSKFGFNATSRPVTIGGGGTTKVSNLSQSMVDVMSLPMMVAGGALLSSTTQYMNSLGAEGQGISSEIEKVSRPIDNVFGLPSSIVQKTKGTAKKSGKGTETEEENGGSKVGMMSKLMDGFKSLLENLGNKINERRRNDITPGSSNADTSSLAGFIGAVESGNSYTKLVGGAEDSSILNKTVTQLEAEKGGQFAMGRYQIQMRTAKDALSKAGIDPSTFKFDEAGQDKLFKMLLENRGLNDFMSGKITREQFATNLSKEWAALPKDASNISYYSGVGGNKAHRTWDETLAALDNLKASGGDPNAIMSSPTGTTPPPTTQPQSGQQITQNYGMKTGQEFSFSHNGKIYKAHKTAVGFEFFDGMTRLDTNGKNLDIVQSFIKAKTSTPNLQPPATTTPASSDNRQASLLNSPGDKSTEIARSIAKPTTGNSGTEIAMLNLGGGGASAPTAGSVPQVSGHDGTESGSNPTRDFYNNPYSIGVG